MIMISCGLGISSPIPGFQDSSVGPNTQSGPVFNARSYGARPDGRYVSDGSIQAGSTLLTAPSAGFSQADVGKQIHVLKAGPQVNGKADSIRTTILAVQGPDRAVLATPAQTSASNVTVAWGANNREFIQQAINSAAMRGGGTVYIPAGTYIINDDVLKITSSNIRLTGDGDRTIIYMRDTYDFKEGGPQNQGDGKPEVFIGLRGTPIANIEIDHLKFANSGVEVHNGINGDPLVRTLNDTVVNNFKFHDLAVETSSRCGLGQAATTNGYEIYNNRITGGLHGLYITGLGSNGYIHDNHLTNTTALHNQFNSAGIVIKDQKDCRVTRNAIDGYRYGVLIDEYPELRVILQQNTILNSVLGIATNMGTDMTFESNTIDTAQTGVWVQPKAAVDNPRAVPIDNLKVETNTIKNITGWGIYVQRTERANSPLENVSIDGNKLINCKDGIQFLGATGTNVISGNVLDAAGMKGASAAFSLGGLSSGSTKLTDNVATGYGRSQIQGNVVQSNNRIQ